VAASYDTLAALWHGDAFPRDNGIAQHERAVSFCSQKRQAIDIGCGSSGRIIELLVAHGFEVEGLDLSVRMIELATRRHPEITFHHADICNWPFPRRYDLISAWDSIWHVPLPQQDAVLAKLMQNLTPGGVCVFTMGGLDAPAEKVDAAMGPDMYHATLGIPRVLELIAGVGCVCRHLEFDQFPEPHVYLIVQAGEAR
jgi:SAM-dependent methyltransferase